MNIREAREKEAEKITKELWLPLAKEMENVSSYNELENDLNIQDVINHKEKKIASDNSWIFLAENDEQLSGLISITAKESPPIFTRGKKLKIGELFVKKQYRRSGTASKLMNKAEEIAKENSCDRVELNVNIRNKSAKEFYENQGFETEKKKMVKRV